MKKRLLSGLLILCMALTILPVSTMADSPKTQWGVVTADGTKPDTWVGNGSLEDAVTYANGLEEGIAYIELLSDVVADTVTFMQGATTLDLNGRTLSGTSLSGAIRINSGTLTIADSSDGGSGTVSRQTIDSNSGTINVNGGNLVVDGGTIINTSTNNNQHTIFISSGNVTVNGGKVERTDSSMMSGQRYAIYNDGIGTVSVNGGEISGNNTTIYNKGTVSVTDGEVISNYLTVIFNENTGTVNITGGTVQAVDSNANAYAIRNRGSVLIGGGELSGFHAIYCENSSTGNTSISGGKVRGTGHSGYGVYAVGYGNISISGGEISGTDGAIYTERSSNISVTGGILSSRRSVIFTTQFSSGSVSVTGGRVENIGDDIAIFHMGKGKLTIGGTALVTGRPVSLYSELSTIYITNNASLEITGGTVENTNTGTAIYVDSGSVSVKSDSSITIKGAGKAMSMAPGLTDTIVKTAATDINGTDGVETYNPDNINNYKYLEFVPIVAKIGSTSYATVQEAIDAVENNQTITLQRDSTEKIYIDEEINHYFTLDLNGKTLSGGSNSMDSSTISYNGGGVLTITDNSSTGGKITKEDTLSDDGAVVQSSGKGKIIVKGKATISADKVESIYIADGAGTADDVVLEIDGGTVGSSSQSYAIRNESLGKVLILDGLITGSTGISSTGTGEIIVEGGTVKGSEDHAIVNSNGILTLKGGTVENMASSHAEAISCNQLKIDHVDTIVIKSGKQAMSHAPALPENSSSYQWRSSGDGVFAVGPYIWSSSHTYVEIRVAYAVTYQPGTNGTGSQVIDNKAQGIPLTLRGVTFTREGYTQTGWATTDGGAKAFDLDGSYTSNEDITLYPVWNVNTYSVTYQPGTNGTGSQATESKTHGVSLTLRGAIFTREGYTQTGWSTTDGGAKAFALDGSYTGNEDITLYPVWNVNTYSVTYQPGTNGTGSQAAESKTHGVPLTLRGAIFTREGYTQTGWSTTDGGAKAFDLDGSYTGNEGITLYPVWMQNAPNTYTVTYQSGIGYTVRMQDGVSSPVNHGGSFSFSIVITNGYHKGDDFAVKANGKLLTANGGGVYTISNITQIQTVTVEGVVEDISVPAPSPMPTPSPITLPTPLPTDTVYNNLNKSDATIWLTGSGFMDDDLLITQALNSGSVYNDMLKLADGNDVLWVYDISLKNGTKSLDNAMYLTCALEEKYAGQAFTLVHKKEDGTLEFFYATAGADGNVKFGPLYGLSPFMLVKGTLQDGLSHIPKTGEVSFPWIWCLLACVCAARIVVVSILGKRKKALIH